MSAKLSDAIRAAGVVGAGGGGFPTHVKAEGRADTLIANGAECEPLIRADSAVMALHAERVVTGLRLMKDCVGADRAVLAVKRKNLETLPALREAVKGADGIELLVLDSVYPAGDEFLLVYEATGRVVPEAGLPLDVGVVVSNVTTLAQVADAREGRPVTHRFVTVQGEVGRPLTRWTPVGSSVSSLLDAAGGPTCDDFAVIAGGPMMGRLVNDLSEPTDKTLAGIIVLPATHRLISTRKETSSHALKIARAACCQCMACTELCPRALLGHALAPHRTVRAIQYSMEASDHAHVTSAYLCCECGMCELFACPLEIRPRRILAELKAELKRRGIENPHVRTEIDADAVREYRQIPSARLVQRLGLSRYDGPAPPMDGALDTPRVRLMMRQHAGRPAVPIVERGATVLVGDVIGEIPAGALGARVHASLSGEVTRVSGTEIVIERR